MKRLLFLVTVLYSLTASGQKPKKVIKKLGADPIFYIDSVNVDKGDLKNSNPADIAAVTVYKDSEAIRIAGPDGKDGAVYIETKVFARKRYWAFFSSKSEEYAKIVPNPESDTSVQYFLNKRVLKSNFEGDLALINDSTFKKITIFDKQTLQAQYKITDKEYGVLIESDKPANLYHANKKF
jgi:hypothetical protein